MQQLGDMAETGFEAPYTIASFPSPLDRENGRIQASVVYGLRSSKKRKRHEIAVAVDGEGVCIYNVSVTNLVSSLSYTHKIRRFNVNLS